MVNYVAAHQAGDVNRTLLLLRTVCALLSRALRAEVSALDRGCARPIWLKEKFTSPLCKHRNLDMAALLQLSWNIK